MEDEKMIDLVAAIGVGNMSGYIATAPSYEVNNGDLLIIDDPDEGTVYAYAAVIDRINKDSDDYRNAINSIGSEIGKVTKVFRKRWEENGNE